VAEGLVADRVKSWQPDFIITTGDNNYVLGGADTIDRNIGFYYQSFIAPYRGSFGPGEPTGTNRFFPTLGNHDWVTASAQPYLDYFTLPGNERYYDVVWGPVHLFAIDNLDPEPDGIDSNSIQARWLQRRLAASTAPWKLVYMHIPPYSSGVHGSNTTAQWPYRQWGATAVLAGHDHIYERLLVDGLPYFVNGLGGQSIYTIPAIQPGSQARYNGDYGAMLVQASAAAITFQFITQAGVLVDTYTIAAPAPTATPTSTRTVIPTATPSPTPVPTATATRTPTASPTASATATPALTSPPVSCAPRPAIQVAATPSGAGQLQVALTAQDGPGVTPNELRSVQVVDLANATVDWPGRAPLAAPATVTLAPGVRQAAFTVQRLASGPVTVQLVVTDRCGPWPTLVGGGPSAF
jgi:hypothetical protein